jgi:sugar (pentulose or hexulose) kinase
MTRDLVLAIDNGTQSVRALLFNLRGDLLAKSQVPLGTYISPKPGWAEQDPEVFWQAVCLACQELWQMPGVDRGRIAGVALTTQRSTIICMGRDNKPLRPAIVWPDQRRTTGLPPSARPSSAWVGIISPYARPSCGRTSAGPLD